MIIDFDAKFDAAYSAQLYRRFCTQVDQQAYRDRYLNDPISDETDLQAESIEIYDSSQPF